tara:strand:+ start:457 stop:1434 length:978 start_codon:yes stop_codon:yes gene_type:complete
LISLIIPSYNKESYILETLESINNQSFNDWECIIVDDFSDDNSIEIINSFIKDKSKFKLIPKNINTGASSCRNIGLAQAKGKFVIFLDADDIITKQCLKLRYDFMNKKTELGFSVFPMGTFFNHIGDNSYVWNDFNGNHLCRFLSHELPWAICSVIWKKDTLNQLCGFDESYFRLQDVELHSRALLLRDICYKTVSNLKPDCYYRISNERINDVVSFINNDFKAKLFFIENFSFKLKNESFLKSYLCGTFFECYTTLFYFFEKSKINNDEFSIILSSIKYFQKKAIQSMFSNQILNFYIFLRSRKIYFKGMHYCFKKMFLAFRQL